MAPQASDTEELAEGTAANGLLHPEKVARNGPADRHRRADPRSRRDPAHQPIAQGLAERRRRGFEFDAAGVDQIEQVRVFRIALPARQVHRLNLAEAERWRHLVQQHRHQHAARLGAHGLVAHEHAIGTHRATGPDHDDAGRLVERGFDVGAPLLAAGQALIRPDVQVVVFQRSDQFGDTPGVLARIGDQDAAHRWLSGAAVAGAAASVGPPATRSAIIRHAADTVRIIVPRPIPCSRPT